MDHQIYDNLIIDDVGYVFRLHDTKDVTFYNIVQNVDATTIQKIAIDGSSTEPWNANLFPNDFFGCASVTGCIGLRMVNAEHNTFSNIYWEPDISGVPRPSTSIIHGDGG